MTWFRKNLHLRLDALLHRGRYERELSAEFAFHIEQEALENERKGMAPVEARRAALIAFGGVEYQKERFRDQRGIRWLDDLAQDLGHAVRSLRRSPHVTLVVSLTLALGVGMNSAMFSVVDYVLLRPPPYPNADGLVLLFGTSSATSDRLGTSWEDFWDLREGLESFERMAVFVTGSETPVIVPGGRPAILGEGTVGYGFLGVFGLRPALGREFTRDEHLDEAPVIMISYRLWQKRFGADPNILTKEIEVGGQRRRIVGVLPEGLEYPQDADFVAPEREAPPGPAGEEEADGFGRAWRPHLVVARLGNGVTLEAAHADLQRVAATLRREHPATNQGHDLLAVPLVGDAAGPYRSALLALWGAVALILLIACVSVANLLFSRGMRRRKEVAIRLTLGGRFWMAGPGVIPRPDTHLASGSRSRFDRLARRGRHECSDANRGFPVRSRTGAPERPGGLR